MDYGNFFLWLLIGVPLEWLGGIYTFIVSIPPWMWLVIFIIATVLRHSDSQVEQRLRQLESNRQADHDRASGRFRGDGR